MRFGAKQLSDDVDS